MPRTAKSLALFVLCAIAAQNAAIIWGIVYGQNCNEDARIYCVWLNEDAANGCVFY